MGNNKKTETPAQIKTEEYVSLGTPKTGTTQPTPLLDIRVKKETIKKIAEEVIKQREIRYTETLGIFVALFTFISIEFQLTRTFDYLNFLLFSIFFGGILIFFALVLHIVIHDEYSKKAIILIFFLMLIYAVLTYFTGIKNPTNTKQSKNFDIEKINVEQVKIDPQVR